MDQEAMDQIRAEIVRVLERSAVNNASTDHPAEPNEVYAVVCGYDIVLTVEPL